MIFSILTAISQPIPLLLLGGPVAPGGGRVVAVPPRRVPQGVAHTVDPLLAQHLQQAGNARPFYLFEGLEMWRRILHRLIILRSGTSSYP